MTLEEKIKVLSKKDENWRKEGLYRQENKKWLNISRNIAIKVLSKLRENKQLNIKPKTQEELAQILNVVPPYITKIVKGQENMTLKTIISLEEALNIKLL